MTKTKRRRSTVKKSSVTVRWRKLKDKTFSPFLDIRINGDRKTETLVDIGRKGIDRRQDKEVKEKAWLIEADKLREIKNHKYNFDEVYKGEASFLEYYKKYKDDFDKHSPQDVAYLHFENFVKADIK